MFIIIITLAVIILNFDEVKKTDTKTEVGLIEKKVTPDTAVLLVEVVENEAEVELYPVISENNGEVQIGNLIAKKKSAAGFTGLEPQKYYIKVTSSNPRACDQTEIVDLTNEAGKTYETGDASKLYIRLVASDECAEAKAE